MGEATSTLTADKLVPILAVEDIDRSVDFYVDGLGFNKRNEWIKTGRLKWCYLEYPGGASVMVEEGDPDDTTSSNGVGIKLYVWCSDARTFHRAVSARGIEAADPFIGNGMHVVDLKDPDGHDIAFQSPANGGQNA